MAKPTKKQATPAPAPQPTAAQAPRLPGLTIDELKALLGDKEVLIMQLQKQLQLYQAQIGSLAQELQVRQEEIDELRGKGKAVPKGKAAQKAESEAES